MPCGDIVDSDVISEEDRPMNEMEQATETLIFDQQNGKVEITTAPLSRIGEDMDIDFLTLLMEARIVI